MFYIYLYNLINVHTLNEIYDVYMCICVFIYIYMHVYMYAIDMIHIECLMDFNRANKQLIVGHPSSNGCSITKRKSVNQTTGAIPSWFFLYGFKKMVLSFMVQTQTHLRPEIPILNSRRPPQIQQLTSLKNINIFIYIYISWNIGIAFGSTITPPNPIL